VIREIVTDLIDDFIETGSVDFITQLATPLPARLTCRVLGLPEEDWQFYVKPVQDMVHHRANSDAVREHLPAMPEDRDALWTFVSALLEVAEERRKEPKDDVLTMLVNAEINGRRLNRYEIGGIGELVLIGGFDTTAGAIGSILVHLGRDKDLRDGLASEPALVETAVEEFLRFYAPSQSLPRSAKTDCALGDQEIAPGDTIMLHFGAANRDAAQFDSPEEFIPDRNPNRHLTFGTGIHRCLGAYLAREDLKVMLEEVLRRVPDYELDAGGVKPLERSLIYGYGTARATFTPGKREGTPPAVKTN
jgi:cytochrome P450